MIRFSRLLTPLPCAALLCLANAFKPAVIDDLAYLWYARQIVETPLQPFGPPPDGFRVIWYDRGQGAFTLLTPMVVPYWLAVGLSVFGENLVVLKLSLLPFCLLFTLSLYSLLKRFAPGFEKLLLAMTALSPTFLPSINLMVDVPAVALSLAAVSVFLTALDPSKTRWRHVVLAGVLAGLAAQTKYTGATSIAVILLHAIQHRRWRAGIAAFVIAIAIFAGWEGYLAEVYGRSHFLLQLEKRGVVPSDQKVAIQSVFERKVRLIVPLIGFLGGLLPALIPLVLIGFRVRARIVVGVIGFVAVGFLLMALVPNRWAVFWRDARNIRGEVSISTIVVGINGLLVASLVWCVCLYLGGRGWSRRIVRLRRSKAAWFLIGWLAIELAAYFILSPFAAARRMMGIVLTGTLLTGRLLSLTSRSPERRRLVNLAAGFGMALGGLVAWTDYRDAVVERKAVADSIEWITLQPDRRGRVWFTGHWGFHYYAENAGLHPIHPDESVLEAGDWIIYPDTLLRPYGQLVLLEPEWAEKLIVIEWYEAWPLRINPDYYDGFQPIRHHEGYRMRVTIFRVKKKFLAQPV